ncbi:SLC13A5 [Bugula neritina]|uniref:SLC13A5 n=1 Tax=Bugula neritina TaxID=10212 RepID=A0A7J7KHG1_BUGNE|nr:SLC13A5 [Bugula neritina]
MYINVNSTNICSFQHLNEYTTLSLCTSRVYIPGYWLIDNLWLQLGPPILDWPTVQKKLPWGVIILLGGGFALADMCKKSGLSDWLGCKLGVLDSIPPSALVFICGVVMTFFTEFTSNTSSASIFLPILAQLVKSGMLRNFLCLGACMLAINTWGTAYFKLNTFPDWANITTTSQCT